jgi:hypothetical protein
MIGGGAAESDDNLALAFLVFSEVPEQCFALFWIDGVSLICGELPE